MGKSNKKIGVVGYWYATNYGSVLTYFALCKILQKMSFDVSLIDCPVVSSIDNSDFSRIFLTRYFDVTSVNGWQSLTKLNSDFDAFVIGSDQVWTVDASRRMKYMFYLPFACKGKKRIAYGPSFGAFRNDFSTYELEFIRNNLQLFDAVSSREKDGVEILSSIFKINAQQVLDPVFLLSESDYREVASTSKVNTGEHYLLVYLLDPTPDKEKAIRIASENIGLPIKIILDGRKGTFESNKAKLSIFRNNIVYDVKEEDWIKYFLNADYILTDSHHGVVLSIIFQKQFICYANHARGYSRFTSLLNLLKLSNRMVDSSSDLKNDIYSKIDYKIHTGLLEQNKIQSMNWLESALIDNERSHFNAKKASLLNHYFNDGPFDFRKRCYGCSTCSNICPSKAITMVQNVDGFLNPTFDLDKCISCGRCIDVCPAVNAKPKNESTPKVYALMADDETRKNSSSGGAFGIFAKCMIENDGLVCAAQYEKDFSVAHHIISSIHDIHHLQRSKYYQSNLTNVFVKIKKNLEEKKRILFVGTPCQVASLDNYLGKEYDNLLSIDLLCHGVSSFKVFKKYSESLTKSKKIKDVIFRGKDFYGWAVPSIKIIFDDDTYYQKNSIEDPFFKAYKSKLSCNYVCGNCAFKSFPKYGDITIGDFWGASKLSKSYDDGLGTSIIFANNKKGNQFINKNHKKFKLLKEIPFEFALTASDNMSTKCFPSHPNRDSFFKLIDNKSFDEALACSLPEATIKTNVAKKEFPTCIKIIGEIIKQKIKKRELVFWGDDSVLRDFLKQEYNITPSFFVTKNPKNVNERIKNINILKQKHDSYYIINTSLPYSRDIVKYLNELGFAEFKDYLLAGKTPIVIENYDLSKGKYEDAFGNTIEGNKGIIRKVVFRGFNNTLTIGRDVNIEKVDYFDLSNNSYINILNNVKFASANTRFELLNGGITAKNKITIGAHCRFRDILFRLYGHKEGTFVSIGEGSSFEENVEIHSNFGKSILIGKDCMLSRNIQIWAGDGHSVFDVLTKNKTNGYDLKNRDRNFTILGDHVWVCTNSILLSGAKIGDGSIVGAGSVVKGKYPNNCIIAGNPSNIVKTNIVWNRNNEATNINESGMYAKKTNIN